MLDCFAGSGTTVIAAEMLDRKWIGMDQSKAAIKITRERLEGVPNSIFSKNMYGLWLEEPRRKSSSKALTVAGPGMDLAKA